MGEGVGLKGEAPARGRGLGWSLTLTAMGPAFLVGGLIVVFGLILIGGLQGLVDYVVANGTGRVSLIVIGALVAVLGLAVTLFGWKGANRTMELQLAKKGATIRRRRTKTT